jgi:hypothetical protein
MWRELFHSPLEYIDGHKLLVFPSVWCFMNSVRGKGNNFIRLLNTLTDTNRRYFHWCDFLWTVPEERGTTPFAFRIHRRSRTVGISVGVKQCLMPNCICISYLSNNTSSHNNNKKNTSLQRISSINITL